MRARMLPAVIAASAFALSAPALAGAANGAGATVTRDEVVTIPYTNPCTGTTGEITLTYQEVLNEVNADGPPRIHVTAADVGDFTLSDGTTGHFTMHGSFEATGNGLVVHDTTEAHGTTADGTPFSLHFVSQTNGPAPGEPGIGLSFEHCA